MTRLADDSDMSVDEAIDRAADAVADGRPVDWAALSARVSTPEQAQRIECLRIIGVIGDLHRSGDDPVVPANETIPLDSSHAPPETAGEPWGNYRLLEMVGSGSFGSVYRAW